VLVLLPFLRLILNFAEFGTSLFLGFFAFLRSASTCASINVCFQQNKLFFRVQSIDAHEHLRPVLEFESSPQWSEKGVFLGVRGEF